MDKVKEVEIIRTQFATWFKKNFPGGKVEQSCFYHAVFTHAYLKGLNLGRVLISAGSFSYPRIDLDKDDGISATHFSYTFEPTSQHTVECLKNNSMPEMHMWVTLPDQGEIVDLTTRYVKHQCLKAANLKWLASSEPPDFIWCKEKELPEGVVYEPHPHAVALVKRFFELTWGK
jgi:hypothetical protein